MAGENYGLGILFGLLSGNLSNFGNVLEKKAVIDIPKEQRDENFGKKLLTNPLWLTGFVLATIIDPIFLLFAQDLLGTELGPTIVPLLMSSGLIVLAIGSVKIVGEKLGKIEYIGIILMILGMIFLAFSNLEPGEGDITNPDFIVRMTVFTVLIFILILMTAYGAHVIEKESYKGIILSISIGFAFVLSNFWISIMLTSFDELSSGDATIIVLLIVALIILMTTNFYGIARLQVAFKYVDASKAIPLNLAPQQIVPIFAYMFVFALPPSPNSAVLFTLGIIIIVISGYLLVKRQAELEAKLDKI